ncbi:Vacuolar protein sorting-associated protein 53 [Sporothrix stenoceras]|uniref:Vacuolar protein sorting-associated protein 53 n=1 Tax=Sporothrix stenoceras TaxID=5173 RepID=A0ABR3YWP8_9PEZI
MSGSTAVEPSSLDAADYDPINHLNMLFNNTSTLGSLSSVSRRLRTHNADLAASIAVLETAQAYAPDSSLDRMQTAQAELASVFAHIEDVRRRAVQTEEDITHMTADIKRLDGTKRNLTVSMTALKRLQMLTTAYEQLRTLSRSRQYRECAGLLQAVLQLMRHFNSYRSIEQIAVLSRGVGDLQRELLEQVCEDFEMAFTKDEVSARRGMLIEACLVMDALGDQARSRLVTWYVNTELREYRQVFRGNDEAGNLDNIGRRYSWFRRMIATHEEEHAALFPPHWRVNETLATSFCDGTRDDFKGILERSMRRPDGAGKIDVNLLLSCLQETLDFEQWLERRFATSNEKQPRASIDTLSSADERTQTFNGSISTAFEPYLSLWVDSQDRSLAALMPRYRSQALVAPDEEFTPESIAPSALDLFHVYKVTLSQCAKLSTGERLLDLSRIFAKYLDEYAQQVLLHFLHLPTQANQTATTAHQQQQQHAALLAAAVAAPLNDIIVVMNTADFWNKNATQLEESIRKRIDPEFAERVDLSSQADAFLGVASNAVQALVRKVEADCEPAWREMRNTNWSRMEGVSDHSSYVSELIKIVDERAKAILGVVAKPQYARAFCDHLVEYLATAFLTNVIQCRPVSEVAAEQMLLDKYTFTKSFENLLTNFHPPSAGTHSAASASFAKRVNTTMGRVDPLLKTLQVQPSPPEGLVQAYLIHVADRSDTNFRKILDIKGVRKQDQPHLLELFVIHRDSPSATGRQLVASSALLTPLLSQTGFGAVGSGAASLPAAAAAATGAAAQRFDATSLGEKLLNAARDAGNSSGLGLGIVAGGATAGSSGTGSGFTVTNPSDGAPEKATINENLKNIGKFFRRDIGGIGGLGARFGKRDITPTGQNEDGSR